MSDTSKNRRGRELFIQAIDMAIDLSIEQELANSPANGRCSRRHKLITKNILFGSGEKCLPPPRRLTRRAIAAILIAAILLLSSCAAIVIYRNEIAGFFEAVFDDHTVVTSDGEGCSTVEDVYIFTYVPEGYQLVNEVKGKATVAYTYKSDEDAMLIVKQFVRDNMYFNIDNEQSFSIAQSIGDTNIYYQQNDKWHKYIFNHGDYTVTVESTAVLNNAELSKIFEGIKIEG